MVLHKGLLPPTPSPENGSDLSELDREAVSDSKDPDKKREIVIVPIPSLNPTTGWGLAIPLMVMDKPASESPDSPPWTTGIAGSYSVLIVCRGLRRAPAFTPPAAAPLY